MLRPQLSPEKTLQQGSYGNVLTMPRVAPLALAFAPSIFTGSGTNSGFLLLKAERFYRGAYRFLQPNHQRSQRLIARFQRIRQLSAGGRGFLVLVASLL